MYRKNKSLGQHFLKDQIVLQKIIDFIGLPKDHKVFEIGPGAGALTHCLLEHGLKVNAIELDDRWCGWLKKKYSEKNISIINQDALLYPWQSLKSDDVIVGNLPYNIASELMCLWVESQINIKQAVLMMQKEVADRTMAQPGKKDFGRLSIILQTYFTVEPLLNVSPESFDPPPKVQSSIIRLTPLAKALCSNEVLAYLKVVTAAAFSQRRKKCKHGLSKFFSIDALNALNVNPELRPEQLSVEQYIQLAKQLRNNQKLFK